MNKGFLSIDAMMAVFILLLVFSILINVIITNKNILAPWSSKLQILGSIYSTGYVVSELNSNDLNNGKEKTITINYDKYFDILENKEKYINYKISNNILYNLYKNKFYIFPVFAKTSVDYGSYSEITLYGGGGQKSSNDTISLSLTTCSNVLKAIENGDQKYYYYSTIDKHPWNCDYSCMGGYADCAYNCDPSTGLDCNVQCSLVDADLKNLISMTGTGPKKTVIIPDTLKNIGFVLVGPYMNKSLVINDTCGYFPSLDPYCNQDFDQNNMAELFVYEYKFNLSSIPLSEVYLNFKARNGIVVEINNETISCVATGEESFRSLKIRKYLKIGENIIKIGFYRTDSICNPCVIIRPAYSVGGAVKFSCDPDLPSNVQDFFGWYGCQNSIGITNLVKV